MSRIVVIGGTGYAGSAIASEAFGRGHEVTVFSRHAPSVITAGIKHIQGSVLEHADLARAIAGADVVVMALALDGESAGELPRVTAEVVDLALQGGARLGVVGGAGTLLVAPGGPKLFETPTYPEQFRGFSQAADDVLQALRATDVSLDWFVLSPSLGFGSYVPGEATGTYRLGGDVLLMADGEPAAISGSDYARAFVDEIDTPAHRRNRFTAAG